jgi:hypothetical protein
MPGNQNERGDNAQEEEQHCQEEEQRRQEEERRSCQQRQQPPHFDAAAAIADPVFMNVVLCGILSNLPALQAPAPPPQLPAPVARVYVPTIPLVTNKWAFHMEYWKKEEHFLAYGRNNWDLWVDNLVRSLRLVSPLDRWINHSCTGSSYLPRPMFSLTPTWDKAQKLDHWDQNDASVRKLILAVITTDEVRYLPITVSTAKELFDALKTRHRDSNEFTLFAQWQRAFQCTIDSESAAQFRGLPLEIRTALDRIFTIATPTRENLEVMILLNALAGNAESVQRLLIADVTNSSLTVDAILWRFQVEADVRERKDTAAVADGFAAAITSADPRCRRCAGFGHRASKCLSAREWEQSPQVEAILTQPPLDATNPRGPLGALLPRADGKSRGGGSGGNYPQRARGSNRGGRSGSRPNPSPRASVYTMIGGVAHGLVDGRLYPVGTPPSTSPSLPATAAAALEEESPPESEFNNSGSRDWYSGYALDVAPPATIPITPESDVEN